MANIPFVMDGIEEEEKDSWNPQVVSEREWIARATFIVADVVVSQELYGKAFAEKTLPSVLRLGESASAEHVSENSRREGLPSRLLTNRVRKKKTNHRKPKAAAADRNALLQPTYSSVLAHRTNRQAVVQNTPLDLSKKSASALLQAQALSQILASNWHYFTTNPYGRLWKAHLEKWSLDALAAQMSSMATGKSLQKEEREVSCNVVDSTSRYGESSDDDEEEICGQVVS